MTIEELIKNRHSVRKYKKLPLVEGHVNKIKEMLNEINKNDLSFELVTNDNIFKNLILGYGFIKDCNNYIILGGKDDNCLEEKVGYYGEKLALELLDLGINTCFVGGTYKKKKVKNELKEGYRNVLVLAIGYGVNDGKLAKTKTFDEISISKDVPDWYKKGIEMVLFAPSAVNQKKWTFEYVSPNGVKIQSVGKFFPNVDLGIAKYHFEVGAGKENFEWIK
jgi:hypothetical protein